MKLMENGNEKRLKNVLLKTFFYVYYMLLLFQASNMFKAGYFEVRHLRGVG